MSRRAFLCAVLVAVVAAWAGVARAAVLDLDGKAHALDSGRVTAVVFLNIDCPICRKSVATLNELAAAAKAADVVGVISDPATSRGDAKKFVAEYGVKFPVLFDTAGALAARFKPVATPEAFVLDAGGNVKYRGRIDDSFAAVGKERAVVTSHDLHDAIAAIVAGKEPGAAVTPAVGCAFEAWKETAGATPAKVTYARQVAPILNANCVSCHREGEVAPFPLMTYEDAAKHAEQIENVTGERLMPPWKAAPGFGHFADERRLSEREIEVISQWVGAGAPKGEDAEMPPAPVFASGWTMGEPDLVVKMAEPFDVPASGKDVYRAFVVPLNLAEDTFVSGFEFRAGAKSVLHHCLLYLDNTGKARELDAADPGPGYRAFGGPGFAPSGGLGGWAPGAQPYCFPDGIARVAQKGSDLVIQIHYHPDGKPHADRSSLALYFAKKPVTRVVHSIMLAARGIDIPAGVSDYRRGVAVTIPEEVEVVGVIPHMHLLGREMTVKATGPDGTVIPLIHVPDWDFKWQDQYRYAAPVRLPAGTRIEMTARYDNSPGNPANPTNPPKRVRWGEQTTDEMCLCFLQITGENAAKLRAVRREVARQVIAAAVIDRALGAAGMSGPTTKPVGK